MEFELEMLFERVCFELLLWIHWLEAHSNNSICFLYGGGSFGWSVVGVWGGRVNKQV